MALNELRYNNSTLKYSEDSFDCLGEDDAILVFNGYVYPLALEDSSTGNMAYLTAITAMVSKKFPMFKKFLDENGNFNVYYMDEDGLECFAQDFVDMASEYPKMLLGSIVCYGNEWGLSFTNGDTYDILNSPELHALLTGKFMKKFDFIEVDNKRYSLDDIREGNYNKNISNKTNITRQLFHGTSTKYLPSILTKGLRGVAENSTFAVQNEGHVFMTVSFKVANSYATNTAKLNGGEPAVIMIDGNKIDENKVELDMDFAHSHTKDRENTPFPVLHDTEEYEMGNKGAIETNTRRSGTKYGKIGFKGIIMPNAIEKVFVNKFGRGENAYQEFTRDEYLNTIKNEKITEAIDEDPDRVFLQNDTNKTSLRWFSEGAYPFIVDKNCEHLFITRWSGGDHGDVMKQEVYPHPSYKNSEPTDWLRTIGVAFHGRIWIDNNIISFWKLPSPQNMSKIANLFKERNIDISNFDLELGKRDFIKVAEYCNGEETKKTNFDTAVLHTMKPEDKVRTPQMQSFLKDRSDSQSRKLGNITQAEYNFYRRYGMGESILKEDPDTVHNTAENLYLSYEDDDAIPFIVTNDCNRAWVGVDRGGDCLIHVDIQFDDGDPESDEEDEWGFTTYVSEIFDRNNSIHGRFWLKGKVISFWTNQLSPQQVKNIVSAIMKCPSYIENYKENLWNFKLEITDDNSPLPTVQEYVNGQWNGDTNNIKAFDRAKMHVRSDIDKSKDPAMKAFLDNRYEQQAQKLGNMTQAEYNHYRRYGMGESVIKESPDYINNTVDNVTADVEDNDAVPFIVAPDCKRAWIGESGDIVHDDIAFADDDPENTNNPDSEMYGEPNIVVWQYGRDNSYHGRFWYAKKIFSLWDNPIDANKVEAIVNALKNAPTYRPEFGNFMEYRLDLGNNVSMPTVNAYINGEDDTDEDDIETFDKATLHVRSDIDKSKDPDRKAFLDNRDEIMSKKLGNMSQAEYNYYRRYGMGESIVNEVSTSDVNMRQFDVQNELHPKFWVNDKLNSRIRLKLMDIADDFIDELALKNLKVEDIVFTGSLANYNWSRYSDIDLHILVDYKKVYKNTDFVADYFNTKKELWKQTHEDLKIYGFPVEIYVEDTNAENNSTGKYSLNKNKWIEEPQELSDAELNTGFIKRTAVKVMNDIDSYEEKINKETDKHKIEVFGNRIQKLLKKLQGQRAEDINRKGEMSTYNIIWKIIRRMGYLDKMWDLIILSYDKSNSIDD